MHYKSTNVSVNVLIMLSQICRSGEVESSGMFLTITQAEACPQVILDRKICNLETKDN